MLLRRLRTCLWPPQLNVRGGHREDQYNMYQGRPRCILLLLVIQEYFQKREEMLALVVTQHLLHKVHNQLFSFLDSVKLESSEVCSPSAIGSSAIGSPGVGPALKLCRHRVGSRVDSKET